MHGADGGGATAQTKLERRVHRVAAVAQGRPRCGKGHLAQTWLLSPSRPPLPSPPIHCSAAKRSGGGLERAEECASHGGALLGGATARGLTCVVLIESKHINLNSAGCAR